MGLIEEITARNRRIVRGTLKAIKDDARSVSDDNVLSAIHMLNRDDDFDQVNAKRKSRYAFSIGKADEYNSDITGSEGGYRVFKRGDVATAIDVGFMETISTGFMSAVCNAISFQSDEIKWSWNGADGQTVDDEVTELITYVREQGGFAVALDGADFVACGVESCYIHPYYQGVEIRYDVVYPSDIYFMPTRKITEYIDGKEVSRTPNSGDIDDYGAVVIRLTQGGDYNAAPDEDLFLAYIGASDSYPLGRRVSYTARDWKDIPEIGDNKIVEEYIGKDGKPCNPLSRILHSSDTKRYEGNVEYPIIPIRGGHMAVTKDIRPITMSLYHNALEIELGWSQLLKDIIQSGSGTKVLNISDMSMPIPESLDVMVLYGDGSDYKNVPLPISRDTIEMHQAVVKAVAGGFSVPGYTLIGQMPNLSSPESGISLAIQTAPLNRFRNKRVRINKDNMTRLYEVEKALLIEGVLGQKGVSLFDGVKQTWDPGTFSAPKDDATRIANAKALLDSSGINQIEYLRRIHGLDSDEEAQELYDKYKEQDPQYDKEPEKPQGFGF
jgi:hypothetical protein